MAASTQMAAPSSSTAPDAQRFMAQTDIGTAWESHKQNGLAFGRQCHEWGEKFKAQGSQHGSTFQEILKSLDIPRHIADYWADKHKASIGQGIPCEHCTETFPSKTQLKKHQHNKHPELFQGTPRAPFVPALPTRTDGSVDVHTTAIAEGCDYCRRHASCLQCPVHGPVLAKQLKDAPAVITDAVNFPDNELPTVAPAVQYAVEPVELVEDDREFKRLRQLAKNAGYHLATSARDDAYDLLGLTAAQVEMFIKAAL